MFEVRNFGSKTLSWWYSKRDSIDFEPLYQRRGGIWTTKDRAYLIDSIVNNYDIPKIYLADFSFKNSPLNEKKKTFAVIDGKQRFEAIFSFFNGDLVLDKNFQFVDDPSLQLSGLSYKDLKTQYPTVASKFDNFNLDVMSVITDEEGKINDLFVRLNRSKPLVGAEIRNAMSGKVPPIIRRLVSHAFFKNKIAFTILRKQDHNAATKLLLVEFRGKFVDTKKSHLDRLAEEGLLSEAISFDRAAQRVTAVLDDMVEVFINRDPLLRSQGPLTIYYWFIKNYAERHKQQIREFLVRFDEQRRENKLKAKAGEQNLNGDLLTFDILGRSTNDQGSLTQRYEILRKYFAKFIGEDINKLENK